MKLARSISVITLLSVSSGAFASVPLPSGTTTRPPTSVVIKVTPEEAASVEASIKAPKIAMAGVPLPRPTGVSLHPAVTPDLDTPPPPPRTPKLNVGQFHARIHGALKDETRGYALGLRKGGAPVLSLAWDVARARLDGNKAWTLDTRMHIGQASEHITAITMVRMLEERGISLDARIGDYLPSYWTVGANNEGVTFRELITHRSGLDRIWADYATVRAEFAAYNNDRNKPSWSPANYGLLRVLSGTVTGAVNKDAWFAAPIAINPATERAFNDGMWDAKTTDAFLSYARTKVFAPSGVSAVTTVPVGNPALAYPTKWDTLPGWDSGDLKRWLGALAFRLSVNEVLDVMSTYRRKGTILSATRAKQLIEANYGLLEPIETPAGKIHWQFGFYTDGYRDGSGGTFSSAEQAILMYLPDDMELVVLVNSYLYPSQKKLDEVVRAAYVASLQ